MKIGNKEEFLKKSTAALDEIYEMLNDLETVRLKDFSPGNTVLIIIDLINGFTRCGALKSERVEKIIPEIARLSAEAEKLGIRQIAFADSHTDCSPEFVSYPPHCLEGTEESEIVDELKEIGAAAVIKKNSTNGFLEEEFLRWLKENDGIKNFIIAGDCTDICILQFALTLKTWFNRDNKVVDVIVPANAVETFDIDGHNGDLSNAMSLYFMKCSGIRIVSCTE